MNDCPCDGARSVNWHRNNKIDICLAARKRRNEQTRAAAAAKRPPKVEEVQEDCPCGGEKPSDWHRHRKLKPCLAARRMRRKDWSETQKMVVNGKRVQVKWVPGTSILVPEIDPL